MGRSTSQETLLSDKRKYRKFTAKQKVELVLASFRGERSVAEICREHDLSETLLRRWRDQMIDAGAERFQDGQDRSGPGRAAPPDRRARADARAQDLRAGDIGKALAGLGVGVRVTRSRELVA